ncbi:hypothetical protein GCM10009657_17220 [Oryzihumus leptocrescens]
MADLLVVMARQDLSGAYLQALTPDEVRVLAHLTRHAVRPPRPSGRANPAGASADRAGGRGGARTVTRAVARAVGVHGDGLEVLADLEHHR